MLIKRLVLKNLLSFRDSTIELGQLNVLIGPNAVGKSNLIEVIGLLQAAPASFAMAILRGGGVRQWIWLGDPVLPVADVVCELELTRGRHTGPVTYGLRFSEDASGLVILGESVERLKGDPDSNGVYLKRVNKSAQVGSEEEFVMSRLPNPRWPNSRIQPTPRLSPKWATISPE